MNKLWRDLLALLRWVDKTLAREEVRAFQGMYYLVFIIGGLTMLFVPGIDAAGGQVYLMLGPESYQAWAWLVVVCPMMTLVGRYLTGRSVGRQPGDPNPAWGAAWLQFAGDFGVSFAVTVCVYELFRFDSHWWARNLFLFLFLVMGVLGGMMFTIRSLRRMTGVKREVRQQEAGPWAQ